MKDRGTKRVIWTAALAISLVAVRAQAQTAGQAKAAQAVAGQAKSGGTSSAPPSAPRASSAAAGASKTAAPAAGAKTAPGSTATSAKQAAPASGAAAGAATAQAAPAASAAKPASATANLRRDPFRPLVIKGKSDELPARLPPGKPGLVIGQLTVQGIVRSLDGRWIAVVDNKTKRAYFLYAGDQLYNGSVNRITENSVVFGEKYTDPTGKQSSRDVVKQLAR